MKVKHETIEGHAMLAGETETSLRRKSGERQGRYDLATALRIVRHLETSASRAAVFEEIKRKNAVYRLVDRIYALAGRPLLQPLILWAYMLKCVLTVGPFRRSGAEVIALAHFPNEQHTIERVAALVPDLAIDRLSMQRRNIVGAGQLKAAVKMVAALPRVWPFLRRLARDHDFMPAGRIASGLAFYMRFNQAFEDRPGVEAAIVASNYSPEAVGLAAAAHEAGKKVIYANHAPVPANSPVVPPVYSQCALFYGEETARTYRHRSQCTAQIALIGQPGTSRALEWRDDLTKVGIFLTAGTRTDTLSALIRDIRQTHPDVEILIRDHPVALLRNNLTSILTDDPKVELTIGNPLENEIAACDMILCGNSGVTLNALCGGRPVAYIAELDDIRFDYNGFVKAKLVAHVRAWSEDIYDQLKSFYRTSDWNETMRRFDASYDTDVSVLNDRAAEILRSHLRAD